MEATMEKIPTGMLNPEAERYFGVILEQLNGKLDHLLEYVPVLDERLRQLEIRIERIEAHLDVLDGRVFVLEKSAIKIKEELEMIRKKLDRHIHAREYLILERRVTKIEKALAISH